MIRLDVDGRFFHIQFRHLRRLPRGLRLMAKAITTCAIVVMRPEEDREAPGDDIRFAAIGHAICDYRDNFSRRRGRLKAFANALDHCHALLAFKARIWQAYFAVDPDPPPGPLKRPKLADAIKRARWEAGWEVRQRRRRAAAVDRAAKGEGI